MLDKCYVSLTVKFVQVSTSAMHVVLMHGLVSQADINKNPIIPDVSHWPLPVRLLEHPLLHLRCHVLTDSGPTA